MPLKHPIIPADARVDVGALLSLSGVQLRTLDRALSWLAEVCAGRRRRRDMAIPPRMLYAPAVTSDQAQRITERFQLALALYDLGERMLRQKLRRKHPAATEAEIDAKVAEWLAHRPGAEHGDGVGTPVAWPRRRA